VYQSKEARLQQAVRNIAQTPASPEASAPQAALPAELSLQEFKAFADSSTGIVLDARPEIFHRLGHVPKAISLPRDDFQNAYQTQRPKLETNKEVQIAIYCSGGHCEDSHLVKKALADLGFHNVSIFKGGWAEWTGAGLPEETTQ
jgi:rhodanese-related sulfurtransferase